MNTIEEDCSSVSHGSIKSRESQSQSPSASQLQSPQPTGARNRKETPIRVRDMINLYNFATQKNQELEQAKSIYFGSLPRSEEEQMAPLDDASYCNMSLSEDKDKGPLSQGTFIVTTNNGQTLLHQSLNDGNPADKKPVEKTYQSKTTIRRTDKGVRIVIDIFFDKDSEIDIVGSRVETDIPESRILTDFQHHSLAMKNQEQEPGVQMGPSAQST
ncbi:uncharacterized protein LOC108086998 [Drosophila ficusphila]|uniref:uncharacterized protein LOC108086998 n=1 Tax=Drosophila ficusphila TaxID=30025 RepID=UPI0007E5FAEB|nr:uncharacterized protein LOC108086998 [Drosophila ficusphila]